MATGKNDNDAFEDYHLVDGAGSPPLELSAKEEADRLWARLEAQDTPQRPIAPLAWPQFSSLRKEIMGSDYTTILEDPSDMIQRVEGGDAATTGDSSPVGGAGGVGGCPMECKTGGGKVGRSGATVGCPRQLSPHGCVCRIQIEWFHPQDRADVAADASGAAAEVGSARASLPPRPPPPAGAQDSPLRPLFSGLFRRADHGILRLSTGIRPPSLVAKGSWVGKALLMTLGKKLRAATLFPTAAIKMLRGGGRPSGNLLFGGCKTGQREADFFAHCLCTSLTERLSLPLRPVIGSFRKAR